MTSEHDYDAEARALLDFARRNVIREGSAYIEGQIATALRAADARGEERGRARGRAEGIEEAARAVEPLHVERYSWVEGHHEPVDVAARIRALLDEGRER